LKKAPTFKIGKATGGLGIVSPNWQIHTMEYTGAVAADGGLAINANSSGFQLITNDLASGNALPVFDMP
jgi:hypothetical protein